MRGAVAVLLLIASLASLGRPAPPVQAAPSDDAEIQLGRRGAQQIESRFKLVTDQAVVERLARVGLVVAAQTPRPHLPYTFKAVEMAQVNAVALPGGFIYVTSGLLAFVRSDHELAAVLAHEAAHAALGHGVEMMRRQNQALFISLLVAIFTRDPSLAQGAIIFSSGLMAGYTRDLEREADLASIDYLTRTPYSPVGVLTVLEHLYRREQLSPQPEPILPDHPRTVERVQYVEQALRARRIPITRRPAAHYLVLSIREGTDGGVAFAEILVNNQPVVRLADPARIREAAALLDRFFDDDLEPYEVTARESQGGWGVFTRGFAILRLTPTDVPANRGSVREFAQSVAIRLRSIIDEDIRRRRMSG